MQDSKENKLLYKRYSDLCRMAYQRGICLYSDFADVFRQSVAWQVVREQYPNREQHQLPMIAYGGYEDAERKMICFAPEEYHREIAFTDFPLCCVRMAPVNKKYCEKLTHRDYLGTVLGLGLDRDQIGDILIQQEKQGNINYHVAYVFCKKNIASMITEIHRIRHTTIQAQLTALQQLNWQQQYKDIAGSVSSLRLDASIAVALRMSRTQAVPLIQEGNVCVNGMCCTENAKILQDGDILSVKGHGKYRFSYVGGVSKKGRYRITIQQYI